MRYRLYRERERDEEEEDKKEINFIYQRHRSLIPRRSNGQLRNRIVLFRQDSQ